MTLPTATAMLEAWARAYCLQHGLNQSRWATYELPWPMPLLVQRRAAGAAEVVALANRTATP